MPRSSQIAKNSLSVNGRPSGPSSRLADSAVSLTRVFVKLLPRLDTGTPEKVGTFLGTYDVAASDPVLLTSL